MKKKILTYLYIALFMLALLIPGLGILLFGEAQPGANEILASRPKLLTRDGGFNWGVLSDFSDYMADRFAFRQDFVTAWAWLNAELLSTSVEAQVVLGTDGWLYYSETVDDYMGLGLSDGLLQSAARNLALMQEYAESQGADFLFTLAPNKNSLYPGRMPRYIPAGTDSNASRLPAFLEAAGVRYADLYAPFRAQSDVLYYQTDSHWTNRGAALAADTLLAALGRQTDYFGAFNSLNALASASREDHRGDLYEMLYPTGHKMEPDIVIDLSGFTTDRDANGGDAITIRSHSENTGALLCYRDSFGAALYPYLADSYGEALFSRQAAYDLTRMEELSADTVLIELVERNIPWLLTQAHVFPAPTREAEAAARLPQAAQASLDRDAILVTPGSGTDLVRVTGLLPVGWAEGSPIYLQVGDTWVEAGATLDSAGQGGFSAWLPKADGPARLLVDCGGWTLYS